MKLGMGVPLPQILTRPAGTFPGHVDAALSRPPCPPEGKSGSPISGVRRSCRVDDNITGSFNKAAQKNPARFVRCFVNLPVTDHEIERRFSNLDDAPAGPSENHPDPAQSKAASNRRHVWRHRPGTQDRRTRMRAPASGCCRRPFPEAST